MAGRAARNVDGLVIFYADNITESMQRTIDETDRRREKQIKYNQEHGIVPRTIRKSVQEIMLQGSVLEIKGYDSSKSYAAQDEVLPIAAEDAPEYRNIAELDKLIAKTKKAMEKAAKELDFMEAARLRDNMLKLQKEKESMK
jgi:excinuclease ABC subunit B